MFLFKKMFFFSCNFINLIRIFRNMIPNSIKYHITEDYIKKFPIFQIKIPVEVNRDQNFMFHIQGNFSTKRRWGKCLLCIPEVSQDQILDTNLGRLFRARMLSKFFFKIFSSFETNFSFCNNFP